MDIEKLRKAKLLLEKQGLRFVRELDNKEMGGIIDSYEGPGRFVWIAITIADMSYGHDERELIKEILRYVAEGML